MATSCEQGTCEWASLCTPKGESRLIGECREAELVFGDVECPMQRKWADQEALVGQELFEAGVITSDGKAGRDEFAVDFYLSGGEL